MNETTPFHLNEDRWRRLEALFHAAAELSDKEREAFIEHEADSELRLELRAMLLHDSNAGDRIARAIERVAGPASWDSPVGRHFGPYRIVREIGRGGMGVVFEAWRDDAEYDKRVALKIAPDWRDLNELRGRFRIERQILARLEHPNIARFLDGGTEGGVPYFAMEFVDGRMVTEWVRERNLGVRERIAVFRQICAAVSCAHENLVVHRDLKPSNILVDRTDTVKLLDFGIATLLSPVPEQSTLTAGARRWTPDYTSPEQMRGDTITVRTDVYSLGLVLYELLCDERAQTADISSPRALEQSICETEPQPPSARAAARGQNSLSRQLRGDLDTIVAMAIRKEPERRYPSVAAMDADLGRYLDGRTVEARPGTPAYRLSKFVRRHRVAMAAGTFIALSLAGGIASTMYQARRAERRFQQLRSLANTFVFDVHDRIQYLPGSTEARQVIVTTALRYLENLRQDAGKDAVLLRELAAAYERIGDVQGAPNGANLGDSKGALVSYQRAESILTPLATHGDHEAKFGLASAAYKRGVLRQALGDPAGVTELESARAMARELTASKDASIPVLGLAGNIDSDLTRHYSGLHDRQRARETALEGAEFAQRMVDLQPGSMESLDFLALSQSTLGIAYRSNGELELSAEAHRKAVAFRERLVSEHPENVVYRRLLLIAYGHLGDALGPPEGNALGQLTDSVDAYRKAAEIAEWISQRDPADHKSWFDIVAARMRIAAAQLEEPDGASQALESLTKSESLLGKLIHDDPANQRFHFYAFMLDCQMGKALMALGRDAEAIRRLERARLEVKSFYGGPNENNGREWALAATVRLGLLKAKTDTPAAAELAGEAVAMMEILPARRLPIDWAQASEEARLGRLYLKAGHAKEGALWLGKSAELWRRMKVPGALESQRQKALAAVMVDLENR